MAIVWQNNLDGRTGSATVANSQLYGDPLSAVSGIVVYQTAQRYVGVGAVRLGSATSAGSLTATPATGGGNWSVRAYVHIPAGGRLDIRADLVGESAYRLLEFDNEAGFEHYSVLSGHGLPTNVVTDMLDSWVRVEFTVNATDQVFRVWWTDPHSAGEPDYSTTSITTFRALTSVQFEGNGYGSGTQAWADSVAVAQGEQIGPYQPPTGLVFSNALNGPNGVQVTTANTADYGDPFSLVQQQPTYSSTWTAAGSGSVLLSQPPAGVPTLSYSFGKNRAQLSARFYIYVPSTGGRFSLAAANSLNFVVSPIESTWAGGSLAAIGANLLDRTVRVEMLWVDRTCTLRLWWTNPHSAGPPDHQATTSTDSWQSVATLNITGAGSGAAGSWVDEIAYGGAEWIGPPLIHTSAAVATIRIRGFADGRRSGDHPAEGRIRIRGEADGRMELPTAATGRIRIRGEADGIAGPSAASGGVVDSMWLGPVGLLREMREQGDWERTPALGAERHVALSGQVTSSRSRRSPRTTSLAWGRLLPEDADALEELALVPARGDGTVCVIDPDAASGNLLTAEQSRGRPQAGMVPGAVEDLYSLLGAGAISAGTQAGVRFACTNNIQAGADVRWLHPYYGARGWPVMPGWSVYLTTTTAALTMPAVSRLWLTFRDHAGATISSAAGESGSGAVEADAPPGAVTVTPHMIATAPLAGLRVIGEARMTYGPARPGRPLGNGCPVYTITGFSDTPSLPYRSVALTLEEVRAHASR